MNIQWFSGVEMDEDEIKAKLASLPWRTPASLRVLYQQAPTPELAAAIWEIYRLHRVIREAFRRFDKGCAEPATMENICRLGAHALSEEPCIKAHLDAEWQKRDQPGTRYHDMAHVAVRPPYRPPLAPDRAPKNLGARAAAVAAAERGEPPPLPTGPAGTVLRPGSRYVSD